MGTTYTVKIDGRDLSSSDRTVLRDTIQATLDAVERLMSTYDSLSELSRFNRHESTDPFVVSATTLEVFRIARLVSERSGGAFDITVGPLVDAWGFGPAGLPPSPPSDSVLAAVGARVGYNLITLSLETRTVRKSHPKTVADLSAIAKGYAVDLVAEALAALGVGAFLVEVGGELKARGRKADGSSWRVGIERPDSDTRTAHTALDLVDMAVATSGDYRNYYEVDGVRYSHLIDPRTRAPVRHAGASVTVLHPDAVLADAWATALGVLDPLEGLALAEREGIAALFLVRSENGVEVLETAGYQRLSGT
jgi:thiamine biosynthesis lipoprotein